MPKRHQDVRGYFSEVWNRRALAELGIDLEFVQENHSRSCARGTVRGLHFQSAPRAQDKLVRVTRGAVLDVAVDLRRGSPTFQCHVAVELSAENGRQMLVPKGFAHGFATLQPATEVTYLVTDYHAPEHDLGIAWDDPALGIDWRLDARAAVLSEKDRHQPTLAELDTLFE